MKIADLSHASGYWTATVHIGKHSWPVDRKHGSWRALINGKRASCDVRATVAAELQRAVRKLEKEGHGVRAASR